MLFPFQRIVQPSNSDPRSETTGSRDAHTSGSVQQPVLRKVSVIRVVQPSNADPRSETTRPHSAAASRDNDEAASGSRADREHAAQETGLRSSCKHAAEASCSRHAGTTEQGEQEWDSESEAASQVNAEESKQWTFLRKRQLIAEYAKRKAQFDDPGSNKRVLWKKIAKVLSNPNWQIPYEKCQEKWRKLKARYTKKRDEQFNETGRGRSRKWPFYDDMHDVLKGDDNIVPPVVASVGATRYTVEKRAEANGNANAKTERKPVRKRAAGKADWSGLVEESNSRIGEILQEQKLSNDLIAERNELLRGLLKKNKKNDC